MTERRDGSSDTMARLRTPLADRYRLERELGAGGMATVYLARDLKHDRHVALKVLHPDLGAVLGGDRFLSEIRTTANLQHPGILGLIDSGSADGLLYYVMPYVDGESLRAKLEREGELPVVEAVRLAGEVAQALEYAHEHGVIHRDIKPENILLQSGRPLLADFGIALAVQQAGGGRLTQTGLSLGTPQYMSPEQAAADKRVDARSDLYSLGAVTYEMLAGEAPFAAPSTQAVLMKVMTEDPRPLASVRPSVPAAVAEAVHTALAKRPADRFGSMHEFADALAAGVSMRHSGGQRTMALPAVAHATRRPLVIVGAIAALATIAAVWGWLRPRSVQIMLPPSALSIMTPAGMIGAAGQARLLDISPDGEMVAYCNCASNSRELVVQRLDQLEPTLVPGTNFGIDARFTPDGRSLVYGLVTGSFAMYRAELEGGKPAMLANAPSSPYVGWGPDGTAWISENGGGRLLHLLADDTVEPLQFNDNAIMLMQQVLPDGRQALMIDATARAVEGPLTLVDLRTGKHRPLLDHPVVEARWAVGHLVLTRADGAMYAVPFDLGKMHATGAEVRLADNVSNTGSGLSQFAVARNGTVVYAPQQPRELVLVDRTGKATPLLAERRNYHSPRFSPDGNRIAMDFSTSDGRDIWLLDRTQGTVTRLTSERDAHDPAWMPDGRSIAFTSFRRGGFGVFRLAPDGRVDSIMVGNLISWTGQWLPDGRTRVTTAVNVEPNSGGDVVLVDDSGHVTPMAVSAFDEGWPAVSPDGRWLAYVSTQSGQAEVYVRPIAGDPERTQISLRGGSEPMWSHDGRELFYRSNDPARPELISAAVQTEPAFKVMSRTPLFATDFYDSAQPHANYDVTPDGRFFVMARREAVTRLVVLQNLPELVRRLRGATRTGVH
jgi:serine/threonine-protein kinase